MKERPILFSGPLVRAILAGEKTQTRRPIRHQPPRLMQRPRHPEFSVAGRDYACPFGRPGDRLWVRETFRSWALVGAGDLGRIEYRADGATRDLPAPDGLETWGEKRSTKDSSLLWKPSIFMPRWASRITLEVTGVRVERVQDISEEDARAEGAPPSDVALTWARSWFKDAWNDIYGDWSDNPWVWVVDFKRVTP